MTSYTVYVYCGECDVRHNTPLTINLDEPDFDGKSIGEVYDGQDVAPAVLSLLNDKFRCPATGGLFSQLENNEVFLIAEES